MTSKTVSYLDKYTHTHKKLRIFVINNKTKTDMHNVTGVGLGG